MSGQASNHQTNRRDLLKLSGAGAVAGLVANGLTPSQALALDPASKIVFASWIHGHSMEIEYPDRMDSAIRRGGAYVLAGKPGSSNWFHFAIPTPVIVEDVRLRLDAVMLRFVTGSIDAFVRDVHVYDGESRIVAFQDLYLSEQNGFVRLVVPETPAVRWGIGLSLGVGFGVEPMDHTMQFISAGVDLVITPPEAEP